MPTIPYHDFADYLGRASAATWPVVTLVCGEEMLCQKAYDAVIALLVPESQQALGVERFDGGEERFADALDSLNTYALLSSSKVVVLHDARLFYSAKAQQGLREKMTQAAQAGEMKKAARPFLNLLALSGLTFEDLKTPAGRGKVVDETDGEPVAWLDALIDHCHENGFTIPEKQDDGERLQAAMQKGFPAGHRLVITTDFVDRRKALFKAIEERGLVVDCVVPKGETRADRMVQEQVMQAAMAEALNAAGKRLSADARQRLVQWTGFDLRTLAGNMEKLITFVGDRQTITEDDVNAVLQRTRKDPIFEFTNAIAEKDLAASLFFMQSLLTEGMHPLQLLAAAANQLRRLLVARDFIARDPGRTWSRQMTFAQFKGAPFKAVQADDATYAALNDDWEAVLHPPEAGKKAKRPAASDLVLARNPKSPFPVFQTLSKAERFSLEALQAAMIDLSATDRRMKSTGQNPRTLLEAFLLRLCR